MSLILFDEPLVNLDYKLREEFREELRELFKTRNCIAVYATTEPNEALALGGYTAVLHEGRLLQYGRTEDVYHRPKDILSAEMFSEPPINIVPAMVSGSEVTFDRNIHLPLNQGLGALANWTAYENIAEFFTEHVGEIDGVQVYGHMDYGRRDPSLGWRFHDSWLSMAGMGSPGVPFGNPVDDWGIRVDEESRPVPAQGQIAQQIFWYTAFTADMTDPSVAVTDDEGNPKWRMAPSPVGPYWEEGMKVGYQDVGSWTFFDSTPEDRRTAAWLFGQFTVAKSVSLEKLIAGLTPIRESDIFSDQMTEMAPKLGGLVEFYRSPNESNWTPTGTNVPDYPRMAPLWWQNLAPVISGEITPQEGLDNLAEAMDNIMSRLARANVFESYAPALNEEQDPEYWLSQDGAPKAKLDNEMPQGTTVPYDQMMEEWMAAGTR